MDTLAAQRLVVSLLTFGQGTEVFERFGHNAVRIADPVTGIDLSWNWGMFSFQEPNFLGRFLKGTSQYWMQAFPTPSLLAYYRASDRESVEQVLRLNGAQKLALLQFVRWNEREENKFYHYDYFRDNCSTRVRDALDRVLGGALRRAWADARGDYSFRSEALRLTEGAPFSRLGIDIALGPKADARMSVWQEAYVPMRLRDRLRSVTVAGLNGTPLPLVEREELLYRAARAPEAAAPAALPALYAVIALAALVPLAVMAGLTLFAAQRHGAPARQRIVRNAIAVIAAVWYVLTAGLGLGVAFMELFSAHVFWYGNWNVLLLSPLGTAAAWWVPRAIVRGGGVEAARWLAGMCGGCAAVSLLLSISGLTAQSTGAVAIAFAPTTILLALLVPALTLRMSERA